MTEIDKWFIVYDPSRHPIVLPYRIKEGPSLEHILEEIVVDFFRNSDTSKRAVAPLGVSVYDMLLETDIPRVAQIMEPEPLCYISQLRAQWSNFYVPNHENFEGHLALFEKCMAEGLIKDVRRPLKWLVSKRCLYELTHTFFLDVDVHSLKDGVKGGLVGRLRYSVCVQGSNRVRSHYKYTLKEVINQLPNIGTGRSPVSSFDVVRPEVCKEEDDGTAI